ncbi:MAG: DUF839 domain-containing protein [Acidobacteriales bacterium]|nr:DUF839 domain-containing protein [Terriglobales bacterium]
MRLSKAALLLLALTPALATAQLTRFAPGTVAGTFSGPSSSQTPYVVPNSAGWQTLSLISVGDGAKENGYVMVGIPDGLGALAGKFEQGNYVADKAYMTVFMNHELPNTSGVVRAHGATGAFVSQWTIHLNTLQVKWGEDLAQDVQLWDVATGQYVPSSGTLAARFNRLCSADLPAAGAFFNPATGKGFAGRLFMDGEETAEGRGFAHVITGSEKGTSYELPHLGRFAWENNVAHPNTGDKTIVIGLDDSTPGQIYVYVGDKQDSGNPAERAGLSNGSLFGIRVTDGGANYANGPVARENNGSISGSFSLVNVSDVAMGPAAALDAASVARGITNFARPEDGAWDKQNPRVFYFVVTGANIDGKGQSARLYKLTFDSATNPTGGTIQLIVDRANLTPATPTFAQFDNLTVAGDGSVLIQEDPGNNAYLAQTWLVNPGTGAVTSVLRSDSNRFSSPPLAPFNVDEESSGIIEVTDIVKSANWFEQGRRYFLADMQAHYSEPGELVEGGQLYLIASP